MRNSNIVDRADDVAHTRSEIELRAKDFILLKRC